jgi:hypothetical protein
VDLLVSWYRSYRLTYTSTISLTHSSHGLLPSNQSRCFLALSPIRWPCCFSLSFPLFCPPFRYDMPHPNTQIPPSPNHIPCQLSFNMPVNIKGVLLSPQTPVRSRVAKPHSVDRNLAWNCSRQKIFRNASSHDLVSSWFDPHCRAVIFSCLQSRKVKLISSCY